MQINIRELARRAKTGFERQFPAHASNFPNLLETAKADSSATVEVRMTVGRIQVMRTTQLGSVNLASSSVSLTVLRDGQRPIEYLETHDMPLNQFDVKGRKTWELTMFATASDRLQRLREASPTVKIKTFQENGIQMDAKAQDKLNREVSERAIPPFPLPDQS